MSFWCNASPSPAWAFDVMPVHLSYCIMAIHLPHCIMPVHQTSLYNVMPAYARFCETVNRLSAPPKLPVESVEKFDRRRSRAVSEFFCEMIPPNVWQMTCRSLPAAVGGRTATCESVKRPLCARLPVCHHKGAQIGEDTGRRVSFRRWELLYWWKHFDKRTSRLAS